MKRISLSSLSTVSKLFITSLALVSCGGGGGGDDDVTTDVCSVVKIAGGEGCAQPPQTIAIVATNIGYCTGAFITPRHVLTAAHCIPSSVSQIVVGARGFSSDAARADVHPRFDGNLSSPFDIAVITLEEDAPIVPLPITLSRDVSAGDRVVTFGYGLDEEGDDIVKRVDDGGVPLKATELDVVDVTSGTVFTQSDGSGDTCQGDSGGPLLFEGSDGQRGIIALVRSGPNTCVVDSGFPSENTNIQAKVATDFILSVAPDTTVN